MENVERQLLGKDGSDSDFGPVVVLIVVCVTFFLLWVPVICTRQCPFPRCCRRTRRQTPEEQAEIIRASLLHVNFLGLGGGIGPGSRFWSPLRGMTPEDRREYISNILVSKKVLKATIQAGPEDEEEESDVEKPSSKKTSLLLADLTDPTSTSKHVSSEPCPICLTDYEVGDIMCWSQNSKCDHAFHKDCALEWLQRHEDCPLCRCNYIRLENENNEESNHQDEEAGGADGADLERSYHSHHSRRSLVSPQSSTHRTSGISSIPPLAASGELPASPADRDDPTFHEFLRGVQLFYILSRLQSLADTRPNTTIRLEDVELANGRRGNVEIQPAIDATTGESTAPGLNIRITSDDTESQRRVPLREIADPNGEWTTIVRQAMLVDDGTPEIPVRLQLPITFEQRQSTRSLGGNSTVSAPAAINRNSSSTNLDNVSSPPGTPEDTEEIRIPSTSQRGRRSQPNSTSE
eukprot:Nitzschia sp. Nitz4//scaffold75_size92586//79825//81319//NITZ4_004870-RA/size92586-augustus-gene-0.83-mRNA-1//1//CDS//3329557750//3079//frame0